MRHVHEGLAKHGMGWLAMDQTAGKGQRGNLWLSEPGKNIAMSVIVEPSELNMVSGFHLSTAVALACYELIESYAGIDTRVKWPNDIYWRDRKAGGILIENVYQGPKWKFAIAGMGLNINQQQFGYVARNPVSLKDICGEEFELIPLADELFQILMKKINEPFNDLLTRYNDHLFKKNERVRLKKDNAVFETTVKCVNEFGQLVTEDVMERAHDFGTIEWMVEGNTPH